MFFCAANVAYLLDDTMHVLSHGVLIGNGYTSSDEMIY